MTITEINQQIKLHKEKIAKLENQRGQYMKDNTLTLPKLVRQLYDVINKGVYSDENLTISFKEQRYHHILGGDGRSSPHGIEKKGVVCTFKSRFIVNDNDRNFVKDYLKGLGNQFDDIVFENF